MSFDIYGNYNWNTRSESKEYIKVEKSKQEIKEIIENQENN